MLPETQLCTVVFLSLITKAYNIFSGTFFRFMSFCFAPFSEKTEFDRHELQLQMHVYGYFNQTSVCQSILLPEHLAYFCIYLLVRKTARDLTGFIYCVARIPEVFIMLRFSQCLNKNL